MPDPQSTDSSVQDFADLSAALTGFQPDFIRPFLDPTDLAGTFYKFVISQAGQPMMDALLDAFRPIQTQNPQTIADTLLEIASPTPSNQAKLCQAIILMWYLGSWYPPPFLPDSKLQVISSQAYTKSLVWNVAQAHPMGFSAFTFGYWSQPPASLDNFGVNTTNAPVSGKSSGGGQ